MPKYMIPVGITTVSGFQVFSVEAENKEDAIEFLRNGRGEFVEEEVEVEGLDMEIQPRRT